MNITSNIIVNSNVYVTEKEYSFEDPKFISQIVDYDKLNAYVNGKGNYYNIGLSPKQIEILKTELRCMYAQSDPCWGYCEEYGGEVCKCINVECNKKMKCNPTLTTEYAHIWETSKRDEILYGDPKKIQRYFKFDLIPEEEMRRYNYNPDDEGELHKSSQEKKTIDNNYRIDPLTGRKMVVIGHEWRLENLGSYEQEKLCPIWGFVKEEKKDNYPLIRKSKRIDKLDKKTTTDSNETDRDIHCLEVVSNRINNIIKISEIDNDIWNEKKNIILVDNPAERAYISKILLDYNIDHGFDGFNRISVVSIEEFSDLGDVATVWITNTMLKKDSESFKNNYLKKLVKVSLINMLDLPVREYYDFSFDDGNNRWCCGNMYGVTHIVIKKDDIFEFNMPDGVYSISIAPDKSQYMILTKNGELLGRLDEKVHYAIKSIKQSGNISGTLGVITGITIKIVNNEMEILGIGNLRFIEY